MIRITSNGDPIGGTVIEERDQPNEVWTARSGVVGFEIKVALNGMRLKLFLANGSIEEHDKFELGNWQRHRRGGPVSWPPLKGIKISDDPPPMKDKPAPAPCPECGGKGYVDLLNGRGPCLKGCKP